MSAKEQIRSLLCGGDRRSIGRVAEVIALGRQHPRNIQSLVECLWDDDAVVRMRAADALEKISREQPEALQLHAAHLLGLIAETVQPEVRWHLAVILPRLLLSESECRRAATILQTYLDDRSSLVKTFAMQGLADLTKQCISLRAPIIDQIRSLTRTGTPAMRARGRKLLQRFEHQ